MWPQKEQNRTNLPDHLKAGIEALSGISLDNVKVHYNSPQPAQLYALAYAQGSDIHLAPGQERHLPHETWHVVQQAQGRVKPTRLMKNGEPANDDAGLEHEANVKGELALRRGPGHIDSSSCLSPRAAPEPAVVQGKWFRMSTLLNHQDEAEVAEIQHWADQGEFFGAFRLIVLKHGDLARDYAAIEERYKKNEEVREAAFNILSDTFEDSSKAYTAAEVIELLEEVEIISQADVTTETDDEDDDIKNLTAQFSDFHISVPFRSDVDNNMEDHQVFWQTDDIIVESNPKPLKEIITNKGWGGYLISNALLAQLNGLRKAAKLALYRIAGNVKHNIIGTRTKSNMDAFRNALGSVAKVFANLGGATHAATLMPVTDLKNSVHFPSDQPPAEGFHVKATPLSINSNTSGSQPKDGRLMIAIRKLAGAQSKSYVQMHLLNDLVFGPGQLWNLTPGPKQSNVDMEKNVEDSLKRAVLGKGLVINFEAKVNYSNDPNKATNTEIAQNPDKYRFQSIDFTAEQLEYDQVQKSWVRAKKQDPDVANINGAKVNWRYGSLTPLVPKPRIFDPANTAQDLTVANIQMAAASRIVAFVQANPNWRPTGANKQQQLAQAVKNYDGGSQIPNISSWKASLVLWT